MNLPKPISLSNISASNQITARSRTVSTAHDNNSAQSWSLRDSQADDFEKLIKQHERSELSSSDSSGKDISTAESLVDDDASTDAELLEEKLNTNRQTTSDEKLDALREQSKRNAGHSTSIDNADSEPGNSLASDSTPEFDLSATGQSVFSSAYEKLFSAHVESAVSVPTSPLVNDAAARIIEEMQMRLRRGEVRRWQFTLPGLMSGDVSVVLENLDGQAWHLTLTMPNGCSEEDRLALTHRLSQQIDNVSLSVGVHGE
jgi:hypothetical protein